MATPKIFISYSHDSAEHRNWVIKLAERLMAHGIEVLLDMWELGAGDDIALFMERGLKEADRILMVCTPTYVAKAEAGKGGVGYEKTIMTAEYMRNMDSKRVIPLIRQTGTSLVPAFLGTKKYLDFSTDERAEFNFDELARELHGKPLYVKPPVGTVPNFGTKPQAEPLLAEDPMVKAMRVVMAVYESQTGNFIAPADLIIEARRQGMSRTYFERILALLLKAGYLYAQRGIYGYGLNDSGRDFALELGLV